MRTQMINDPAVAVRLQRIAENGEMEQIALDSFPFTIGRNGDCDLQIQSPKVSREHAVITREGNRYSVEDLRSTNGTSLNGRSIQRSELNDGDILVIADVEFTFDASPPAGRRDTVTIALQSESTCGRSADDPQQLIREIRRVHEMLTHRGVHCQIAPIMDLREDRLFGFQAGDPVPDEFAPTEKGTRIILQTDSRLAEQLCYLNRLIVAEESLCRPEQTHLFLRLHQSEIGGDCLTESLESLAEILAGRHQLVVTLPSSAVGLTSYFSDIRRRLAEIGALVAYENFEAGPAQLGQWANDPPDFVKLAPSLVIGVGQERQRRRLLMSLLDTAVDLHIRIVATGLRGKSDVQVCQELGYPLGEGPVFGSQPVGRAFRDQHFSPRPVALAITG